MTAFGEPYSAWDLTTAAARVSKGLPAGAIEAVQLRLGLSNHEMAQVVHISPRTLTRRRKEARLRPDESERVYRIGRLVDIAARVLGSEEDARSWFGEPNYALGEQKPLELARTEPGAILVERVLAQIEHGIPA
jgi:putative toxin-antitoxin system antitoxin component (TIGR02293 family)